VVNKAETISVTCPVCKVKYDVQKTKTEEEPTDKDKAGDTAEAAADDGITHRVCDNSSRPTPVEDNALRQALHHVDA